MQKVKIECTEKEAQLISRALDLYCRVGLLQFNYLTDCNSLQKLIWDKGLGEEFRLRADYLKELFGYSPNSNPGIFNKEVVNPECRTACHLHQQIRHELWKSDNDPEKPKYVTSASPADICQIANEPIPEFIISVETK